jgi:hypothetical protein
MARPDFVTTNKSTIILLLYVVVGISYFVINHFMPKMGDDFSYGLNFKDDSKAVESGNDLVESMLAHWRHVNGRILVFSIVTAFSFIKSKLLFNVLNTIVFLVLLHYGKKFISTNKSNDIHNYLLLGIGFWFLLPTPAESMFSSIAYSVMYLWSSVINLIFIHFFYNVLYHKGNYNLLFLLIISFVAGWSNEAIAVGVMAAIGIFTLFRIKKASKQQWVMFIAFSAGFCILFLSPGNFNRAGGLLNGNFLINFAYGVFKFLMYAHAFVLLLVVVGFFLIRKRDFILAFLRDRMFFNVIILFTILFNMATNFSGNGRVLFLSETLVIIYLIDLFNIYFAGEFRVKTFVIAGASLLIAIQYFIGLPHWIRYRDNLNEIYADYNRSTDGYVENPSSFLNSIEEGRFIFLPASMRDCGSFIAPYGRYHYPLNEKPELKLLPKVIFNRIYLNPDNVFQFDYDLINGVRVYHTEDKLYYFYEVNTEIYPFIIRYEAKNEGIRLILGKKGNSLFSDLIVGKSFETTIQSRGGKKFFVYEQNLKMKWLINYFRPVSINLFHSGNQEM